MTVEAAVRERVLAEHRGTVEAVLANADDVMREIGTPASRAAVVEALDERFDRRDLHERLVDLLRTAVAAAGYEFRAEPVPAPPYVVLTGRGPLVRATVADGRLVVLLRAFRLGDGGDGYVRADADPEAAIEVRFRRSA